MRPLKTEGRWGKIDRFRSYPVVDKVSEDHSRGKGPGRVHSSTRVVHLKHKKHVSNIYTSVCMHLTLDYMLRPCVFTPMRCPMVTEKPMERAADPRRPFLLSSVTAKMQMTSCMVRKTSTVVAIPRLMPGCSWKYTNMIKGDIWAERCSEWMHFIWIQPWFHILPH